jgi:uncharacterized OsmC-like protein
MATATKFSTIVNGVMVDDLFATIDAVKATPAIAKFKFDVRNRWGNGSHTASTVDTFQGALQQLSHAQPFVLESDEPAILLGKDTAANPGEYLLHALAACLTTAMVYHAAARGIQIYELESTVEGDIDLHGFLDLDKNVRTGFEGIRVHFKIRADVPEEKLQEVVDLAPRYSAVFDSLVNGVPVSVTAEGM